MDELEQLLAAVLEVKPRHGPDNGTLDASLVLIGLDLGARLENVGPEVAAMEDQLLLHTLSPSHIMIDHMITHTLTRTITGTISHIITATT